MLSCCLGNAFMLPWQCLVYNEEFLGLNSYVKNWVVHVQYFYFRMNTWFFRILEKVMKSRNNFKNYFFMFLYHWFFNFVYVHKSELPGYSPCINLPFLDTLPPMISVFSYEMNDFVLQIKVWGITEPLDKAIDLGREDQNIYKIGACVLHP